MTCQLKSVKERMLFGGVARFFQGYFSELDNSELSHLIPLALQNKRDVLFGNLPEIYDFHNRYSFCRLQAASEANSLAVY